MAANTFRVVMHHFLASLIPEMRLIRTLANADLAVYAKVLVADNGEVVIVSVDWLKKQNRYLAPSVLDECAGWSSKPSCNSPGMVRLSGVVRKS
jgi:hypothetical protein